MDYVTVISVFHPGVFVSCLGDSSVYENVIWESGDPIPSKQTLEQEYATNLKVIKIQELSDACQQDIISGFTSDALGTVNFYDSGEVDQLNLIGATTATAPTPDYPTGASVYYAVRPIVNDIQQPKTYMEHSYGQLRKVLYDGSVFKLIRLQKFNDKRDYINNNVLTPAEIDSITWQSTP